jgi:hypothetical protein
MPDDGLPTPRTTLSDRYVRVLVWCKACHHRRDADLQALIDAGRGDVPPRRGPATSPLAEGLAQADYGDQLRHHICPPCGVPASPQRDDVARPAGGTKRRA